MTAYLVDANFFIQAKTLHYGFDFCPAFWDWLVEQNGAGNVASIEKVADELQAGAGVGAALAPSPLLGPIHHGPQNLDRSDGGEIKLPLYSIGQFA